MGVRQRRGFDQGDALFLIALFVVASMAVAYSISQIQHLDAKYEEYTATHSRTDSVYDSLDALFQDYVSTHSHTNTKYEALLAAYETLASTSNVSTLEYVALLATYEEYVSTHSYTNAEYEWLLATYEEYVSTHNSTDDAYAALLATYEEYVSTHSYANTEYEALNATYHAYVSTHSYANTVYEALNATYHAYVSTHSYANTEYEALETERDELRDIVALAKSTVWVESETVSLSRYSYSEWTNAAQYAGYVSVNIEPPRSRVYVQVVYSAYGVEFDETIEIGDSSGTIVFPVLPTEDVLVRVSTDRSGITTETVTVTYHY